MSLELKIDASGSTIDHRQGNIIVRGYFRNLGNSPLQVSDNDIEYSLQAPYGQVEVRDARPRYPVPLPTVPPWGQINFEHALVGYANTHEIDPNVVYRITANLPGQDQDASIFRFRQFYAGEGQGVGVSEGRGVAAAT